MSRGEGLVIVAVMRKVKERLLQELKYSSGTRRHQPGETSEYSIAASAALRTSRTDQKHHSICGN